MARLIVYLLVCVLFGLNAIARKPKEESPASALVAFSQIARKRLNIKALDSKRQKHDN